MIQKYDLIGDIHGYHKPLIALLEKLGYNNIKGHYHHDDRNVIFLGDFIDRGPNQKEVIDTVKAMIDNESALAVMGNHEFNALCFHKQDPNNPGNYLRPRNTKNIDQHKAFLKAYEDDPEEMARILAWFKTLPMWLDLDGLRVIHACWDKKALEYFQKNYNQCGLITEGLIIDASREGTKTYTHLETILKGKEIPLPEDYKGVPDKMGIIRHEMRVRWWDNTATTYKEAYMGPEFLLTHIPDDTIEGDHLVTYGENEPPVFLGHYWLEGTPKRLAKNIACIDYSVAQKDNTENDKLNPENRPKLVAYRWDGEQKIDNDKFSWVERTI